VAVYTVTQVSQHVKEVLESDPLLADVLVEGEVSNLRVSSAGHSYFSLKDDQALLNCVMFRGQPGAELLAGGTAVLVHGRLRFYEPRGSTDFMVDLAMAAGIGELALELERLTLRLEAEGLFEETRKRSLPTFPKVIGVVTSPSGAVFHDIQNVLQRRYPLVELLLAPSLVQGPSAAGEIVAAIEGLNRDGRADVIVLARGGGALEDLWPFNEEEVARAIYASRIPTVSAIGHETDFTISDRVADLRAPTPSAAAEIVVPDQYVLRQQVDEVLGYFDRIWAYHADSRRAEVTRMSGILEGILPDTGNWRRRVDDIARGAGISLSNRLKLTRMQVENRQDRVRALDPVATLRRGYSVVQQGAVGNVVTKVGQVHVGDSLSITVSDGLVEATAGGTAKPKPARKIKAATAVGMERLL
jgi:exodeoxyribonuclease VII large subunit